MEKLGVSIVLLFLGVVVKSEPSVQEVSSAIERAKEINVLKRTLDQVDDGNDVFTLVNRQHADKGTYNQRRVGSPKTSRCPMMASFHGHRSSSEKEQERRANEMLTAEKILLKEGYTLEDLQHEEVKVEFSRRSDGSCPLSDFIECDNSSPFRTIDGSCNNLKEPRWGMAGIAQRRDLEPAYDDGIGSARGTSVSSDGGQLPNSHTISNIVHQSAGPEIRSPSMTLHTFQMGQFLGFDMIATPAQSEVEDCCSSGADTQNCLNIMIEGRNDTSEPVLHDTNCMEFKRSAPAFCPDAFFNGQGRRQQSNAITSFIDASNVYGSSQEQMDQLRVAGTGFMKSQDGDCLPNNPDQTISEAKNTAAYHNAFVVRHNRIAKVLQPYYSDPDTLFRETRKISNGILQKIVYDEYLPSFLSAQALAKYRLLSNASYAYDSSVDATVANSFGIANRAVHTRIPNNMSVFERSLQPKNMSFETDYFAAYNIQRGRDHGLPPYTEYRKQCGLSTVTAWSDLEGHDQDTIRRLQDAGYQTPKDIDLYTGILTEKAVEGGTVGPTLECILGDQFMRLKFGDRFFFEGKDAGLTAAQQEAIKKYTMSRLMCDCFNFDHINYPNAFLAKNARTSCRDIPALDVDVFKPARPTTITTSKVTGE